jgi:multiple sugar transport system permease protein
MFDIPYMLHTGNVVNDYIKTVAVFVYEMFHANFAKPSFGYSGAASVILFIITSILGALVFYVQRDKDAIEKKRKQKEAIKEWKRKQKGGGFSI